MEENRIVDMKLITMDSEAWNALMTKIESIEQKVSEQKDKNPLEDHWLDNQDVCQLLNISKRTLQNYRDSGKLEFSQIGSKIYYKAKAIDAFLKENYGRSRKAS